MYPFATSVLTGQSCQSSTAKRLQSKTNFPGKNGAEGGAFPLGFGYNGPVDKALVFGTEDCKFGSARVIFSHPTFCSSCALPGRDDSSSHSASHAHCWCALQSRELGSIGACSVAVSHKPHMLLTRVRLSACAYFSVRRGGVLQRLVTADAYDGCLPVARYGKKTRWGRKG